MTNFTTLDALAQVSLGYKSLQNDFFYLNQATIDTYGIEPEYLEPIFMFRDLQSDRFLQTPKPTTWIFLCKDKEGDLRGTGALKYIHAMSERPAAKKKQAGATKTIREVLEAQSGGLWYAPKAKPNAACVWLRKAFNTVYAPFIFAAPVVVDQRCNYLEPVDNVSSDLLAAVTTSNLFAYALEINGNASMGAGALEAPTSKLRRYPVFDPRTLDKDDQKTLLKLARAAWKAAATPDWGSDKPNISQEIQALDEWLLAQTKVKVTLSTLYQDLQSTCAARINVARDKVKTTKKHKSENIGSVANGIAEQVGRLLNARQFPENFTPENNDFIPIHIERKLLRRIVIEPLFNQAQITISGPSAKTLYQGNHHVTVTELIARAVLLGRESFSAPRDPLTAEHALTEYFKWFDAIRARIEQGIDESALGTGYEDILRAKIYERLGVHPLTGQHTLPHSVIFSQPEV